MTEIIKLYDFFLFFIWNGCFFHYSYWVLLGGDCGKYICVIQYITIKHQVLTGICAVLEIVIEY